MIEEIVAVFWRGPAVPVIPDRCAGLIPARLFFVLFSSFIPLPQ